MPEGDVDVCSLQTFSFPMNSSSVRRPETASMDVLAFRWSIKSCEVLFPKLVQQGDTFLRFIPFRSVRVLVGLAALAAAIGEGCFEVPLESSSKAMVGAAIKRA